MLKLSDSMKSAVSHAAEALRALLAEVPALELDGILTEGLGPDAGVDFTVRLRASGHRHTLICEVKTSGQPRHTRMAAFQLRSYASSLNEAVTPVFIAPFISPVSQAICRDHQVSYLDLEGNARLVFDGIYIERTVAAKTPTARRELKSIFSAKSARVLRLLLRDPSRTWRVTDLARQAHVSLGQVSNVRAALLDREWGEKAPGGLSLAKPGELLDAWRNAYEAPAGQRSVFYTTMHGSAFDAAARNALSISPEHGRAILCSFSAAQWLAPYARTGSAYFYADTSGEERLKAALKLSPIAKGENVVITRPREESVFLDTIEPAPAVICTSPVQTYLDLAGAGERGREAADYLREERLAWHR